MGQDQRLICFINAENYGERLEEQICQRPNRRDNLALRFPFPSEHFTNEHNPWERMRPGAMGFGHEAIVEARHAKSLAVTRIFEEV